MLPYSELADRVRPPHLNCSCLILFARVERLEYSVNARSTRTIWTPFHRIPIRLSHALPSTFVKIRCYAFGGRVSKCEEVSALFGVSIPDCVYYTPIRMPSVSSSLLYIHPYIVHSALNELCIVGWFNAVYFMFRLDCNLTGELGSESWV